jgi:hypothetical protein
MDWQDAYGVELDKLGAHTSLEELIDVIWKYGILEHISPSDSGDYERRAEKNRDVWARDDPHLYWRLAYATGYAKESYRRHWTVIGGYTYWALARAVYTPWWGDFAKNKFGEDAFAELADMIIGRARETLLGLGEVLHDPLILWDSKCKVGDIVATVESYSATGELCFTTDSEEDWQALYKKNEPWQATPL